MIATLPSVDRNNRAIVFIALTIESSVQRRNGELFGRAVLGLDDPDDRSDSTVLGKYENDDRSTTSILMDGGSMTIIREDGFLTSASPSSTVNLYGKEKVMAVQTNYTQARANFAKILEHVTKSQEPVIIRRRGHEGVVMIPESEFNSMMESYHLLRSPKNALRLYAALNDALAGKGKKMTIEELRREAGLDPDKT